MRISHLAAALLSVTWASAFVLDSPETEIDAREASAIDSIEDTFFAEDIEEREADLFFEDELENIALSARADEELDAAFAESDAARAGFVSKLKAIGARAATLRKTLNSIPPKKKPTGGQILKLQRENSAINSAIKSATAAAKRSNKFSKGESKAIAKYIKGKLAPTASGVIGDFVKHKPGIKKAGVQGIVKSELAKQRGLIKKLGAATKKKLAKPQKGQAPAVIKKIVAAYNRGIKKF